MDALADRRRSGVAEEGPAAGEAHAVRAGLAAFDGLVILCDCLEAFCAAEQVWFHTLPRDLPVVIVKLVLPQPEYRVQRVDGGSRIYVLAYHVPGPEQEQLLHCALCEAHIIRPLLVGTGPQHARFLERHWAPFKVLLGGQPMLNALENPASEAEAWRRLAKLVDLVVLPAAPSSPRARAILGDVTTLDLPTLTSTSSPSSLDGQGRQIREEWDRLIHTIGAAGAVSSARPLNILVLHDDRFTFINTVGEYLRAFGDYSRHHIHYAVATNEIACPPDLDLFDVVVIHYSIRLYLGKHLSSHYVKALEGYGGFKVVFLQDEYDMPHVASEWIRRLGVHCIFTCVPPGDVGAFYPPEMLPHVQTRTVLTGYVPLALEGRKQSRPLGERKTLIGYRGRTLPPWYGALAREKLQIGQRMKEICVARGVSHDIEWDDRHRLYGDAWYEFTESCRATLGTESGSNVLDPRGEMRAAVQQALEREPNQSYEHLWETYVAPCDGLVRMNQISPRIFEAIVLRTALVLFEGTYSGVVEPDVHFIPLEKDFSNVDEVLQKLQDDDLVLRMTEKAYDDVVASGRFSYRAFVQSFDEYVESQVGRGKGYRLVKSVVGYRDRIDRGLRITRAGFHRGLPTAHFLNRTRDPYGEHTRPPVARDD